MKEIYAYICIIFLFACTQQDQQEGHGHLDHDLSSLADSASYYVEMAPRRTVEISSLGLERCLDKSSMDSSCCLLTLSKAEAFQNLRLEDSAAFYFKQLEEGCFERYPIFRAKAAVSFSKSYIFTKNFQLAETNLKEAFYLFRERKDSLRTGGAAQNLASLYYEWSNTEDVDRRYADSFKVYAGVAADYLKGDSKKDALFNSFTTLGLVYSTHNEHDSAIAYQSEALSIARELNEPLLLTYGNLNYASALHAGGYAEASIPYFEKAQQLADSLNHYTSYTCRIGLSYAYKDLGRFKEAFDLLDVATDMEDSLTQMDFSEALTELQVRFETKEKEAQIEQLEQQQKLDEVNRRLLYILVVFLLVIALSVFLFFRQRIKSNRRIAKQRYEKLEKEKEVSVLQGMLFAQEEERQRIARDLHDGIGALLSSARMQISKLQGKLPQDKMLATTGNIVAKAGTEVRRVAHDMMPGVLMELGLTEAIEDFIDRINDTAGTKIKFKHNKIDERFSNEIEIMTFRMAQELINNGLKHAGAAKMRVKLLLENEMLILSYKDDGKGFDASEWKRQNNIGLSNLKSRINFLNADVELKTAVGEGVFITIKIPIPNAHT